MEQYYAEAMQLFGLLADPVRWHLVTALARCDHTVASLEELLGEPPRIIEKHLIYLQDLGLVTSRPNDIDTTVSCYSLDSERMRALYLAAGASLHPALIAKEVAQPPRVTTRMRVLFLCTHNSARSQIAEGLVRFYSQGQIDVWSAGSAPTNVHPLAIQVLADIGIDISHHRSRHVREYFHESFDYVITVCDEMREICPSIPGDVKHIHWSFPDPTQYASLPQSEQLHVFRRLTAHMATMVRYFLYVIEHDSRQHLQSS